MKSIYKKNLPLILLFFSSLLFAQTTTLKPYEQIGEMIKTNAVSPENAVYKIPCGSANASFYLIFALTSGEAVQKPITYIPNVLPPSGYYINFSKIPTFIERGKSFDLVVTPKVANSTITSVFTYAFVDWNRDGVFENDLGKKEITGFAGRTVTGTKYSISVPADAPLGKTRIRVRLSSVNSTSYTADDAVTSGYIYDFPVFVTEKTATTDYLLNVSSSNLNLGVAIIESASSTNDGRFPAGTNVTVKAVKGNVSTFTGWTDGLNILSTDETYTFPLSKPQYLIALFSAPTPVLEAPQVSTSSNPIWYQIKNAQTDNRLNTFISYETTIPSGYSTQLRIQKPEDTTDKFLWRLEASVNGMVKLVNRGTNKQIYSATGSTTDPLNVADIGSDFYVYPVANANGSYTVDYNKQTDKHLNGGTIYNILLYSGGIGTGSGWYFYRVPTELIPSSTAKISEPYFDVHYSSKVINFKNLKIGDHVGIYDLSGHKLAGFKSNSQNASYDFSEKGIFIIAVQSADGQLFIKKIIIS